MQIVVLLYLSAHVQYRRNYHRPNCTAHVSNSVALLCGWLNLWVQNTDMEVQLYVSFLRGSHKHE